MLKIELRAAPGGTPGQGNLRIQGWKHPLDGLELAVQRNQDGYYLDATGHWSASQRWTALTDTRSADEAALQAIVGPWLVDPLTADQRMTYMFYLRSADGQDKGVLRIVGDLLSSAAAGTPPATLASAVAPTVTIPPAPAPEPPPAAESEPAAEPEPEPEPESPPPEKPRKHLLLVLLIALVLAVAAGLAWWWFARADHAGAAEPEASTDAASGPCHPQVLDASQDDLTLLQTCVKSNPTSEQTLALIAAAETAKRCNLAQRLFAYKAQAGDIDIALAYARRYDPQGFTASQCIDKPDGETAAYWYERVLEQQADNAQAKQRLEALQP